MSKPSKKRCARCHEIKCVTQFNFRNKAADLRRAECKSCTKIIKAAHFQANKERITAKVRQYRSENKDKVAEWNRLDRIKNRERCLDSQRKYREKNRDQINAYEREKRRLDPFRRFNKKSVCKDTVRAVTKFFLNQDVLQNVGYCERCNVTAEVLAESGLHLSIHHLNYTNPLDIEKLCPTCHGVADAEMTPRSPEFWDEMFDLILAVIHGMGHDSEKDELNG